MFSQFLLYVLYKHLKTFSLLSSFQESTPKTLSELAYELSSQPSFNICSIPPFKLFFFLKKKKAHIANEA